MEIEYKHCARLVSLRREKEKTINEMAYESGLSASTISNYERGTRIPDGRALIKLSEYFKCSTDYLLGLTEYKNQEQKEQFAGLEKALIDALNKVEYDQKDAIITVLVHIFGYAEMCKGEANSRPYMMWLQGLLGCIATFGIDQATVNIISDSWHEDEKKQDGWAKMLKTIYRVIPIHESNFVFEIRRYVDKLIHGVATVYKEKTGAEMPLDEEPLFFKELLAKGTIWNFDKKDGDE